MQPQPRSPIDDETTRDALQTAAQAAAALLHKARSEMGRSPEWAALLVADAITQLECIRRLAEVPAPTLDRASRPRTQRPT